MTEADVAWTPPSGCSSVLSSRELSWKTSETSSFLLLTGNLVLDSWRIFSLFTQSWRLHLLSQFLQLLVYIDTIFSLSPSQYHIICWFYPGLLFFLWLWLMCGNAEINTSKIKTIVNVTHTHTNVSGWFPHKKALQSSLSCRRLKVLWMEMVVGPGPGPGNTKTLRSSTAPPTGRRPERDILLTLYGKPGGPKMASLKMCE